MFLSYDQLIFGASLQLTTIRVLIRPPQQEHVGKGGLDESMIPFNLSENEKGVTTTSNYFGSKRQLDRRLAKHLERKSTSLEIIRL